MESLRLQAHYGRQVQVDLCGGCHMLWFDGHESINLSGHGVLQLLRAIERSHGRAHQPLGARMACPRCEVPLQRSANLTALGPTAHHECPRGHGAAQSFSLYLAEKGLVRPLYRPELEQLRKHPGQRRDFFCLNCGAALDPRKRETCSYCASPVKVLDVLPLMRAVDRHTGQLAPGPATTAGLALRQCACPHCGQPVDPGRQRRCSACTMPVAITELRQALALIEPIAQAVEAGHVTARHREQRIAELDALPAGIPSARPASGYRQPWWVYAAGATVMLLVGLLLVWASR